MVIDSSDEEDEKDFKSEEQHLFLIHFPGLHHK